MVRADYVPKVLLSLLGTLEIGERKIASSSTQI